MNKLNIIILTSGLSILLFVPQILAQTISFVASDQIALIKLGDRNLMDLAIETVDSTINPTSFIVSKLVLVIQKVETNTTSRQILTEGDELLITVYGTPRANASFRLEGLNRNRAIPMTEVERGVYEGRYTIRRNDGSIHATLTVTLSQQGANSITRKFNQAIAIDSTANGNNNNSPVASHLMIERIETNTSSRQILTEGDELLVTVYGTPRANANFRLEGLNRNRSIPMTEVERGVYEGRYIVRRNDGQINARLIVNLSQQGANSVTRQLNQAIAIDSTANRNDNNGNNYDNNNNYNNGNNNNNNNYYQTLKPEITNLNNDGVIRFPMDLTGQTVPNANVQITIDVLRTVMGFFEVSQTIFQTTVRADRQGNFTVHLSENNLASGTRYRVRLTAIQNNQSQSNELFLRQN